MRDDTVEFEMPQFDPLTLDDVSEQVIDKAINLSVQSFREDKDVSAEVVGSQGTIYNVVIGLNDERLPVWALCSCPWGRRHQTGQLGCSHAVAVYMACLKNPDQAWKKSV